ncbi:unnamed protein product [Linum tenue]|uniref:Uncharacterized protein n=1 Tax=Linum tenue TaxID=586396 RepID=A0AAV0JCA6_9ROSI|nr:unnamed protein product [Linum tenue]
MKLGGLNSEHSEIPRPAAASSNVTRHDQHSLTCFV